MNTLVFVSYNIEPEHWSTFTRAAAVPLPPDCDPAQSHIIPYIVASSASASANYYISPQLTERLTQTLKTELAGFTRADLQRLFKALVGHGGNTQVYRTNFLVLDADFVRDNKVIIVDREPEWFDQEGQISEVTSGEGITQKTVWRWHRVPTEEVWDDVVLSVAKGRMKQGDMFLQEEIWEDEAFP